LKKGFNTVSWIGNATPFWCVCILWYVDYEATIKWGYKREVKQGRVLGHTALDTWENTMGITICCIVSDITLVFLERRTTVWVTLCQYSKSVEGRATASVCWRLTWLLLIYSDSDFKAIMLAF
jgi:hypothetical protein